MRKRTFEKIYQIVGKIPKGKVVTYGMVAKMAGTSPRIVGFALHQNPDPKTIPCHRVVGKDGCLAKNYAFGGLREHKRRLLAEGVKFKSQTNVDLDKKCRSANFVSK